MRRPPRRPPPRGSKDAPPTLGPDYTPRVVLTPQAALGLRRGFNQLASVLGLTLGPRGRTVVLESGGGLRPPEVLDKGGLIARRLVELPDRQADVGAMYLRGLLTRLDETHGDGTATAALLFQHVYNAGLRWVSAGGNAMLLRRALEHGLELILAELQQAAQPFSGGPAGLRQIAQSVCQDVAVAEALGEIFDTLGPWGQIELRENQRRGVRSEFLAGSYWDGGLHNPEILAGSAGVRLALEEPAFLVSNLALEDPAALGVALNNAYQAGHRAIVLVAAQLSPACVGLLSQTRQRGASLKVLAVKPPGGLPDVVADLMDDLAALTGAQPLVRAAGATLADFTPAMLGRARWAWADRGHFGLLRGGGDPAALAARAAALERAYRAAESVGACEALRLRLGNLHGGAYALWLDGPNEAAIRRRRHAAEVAIHTLRGVLEGGQLPGGGWALLACRPALTAWNRRAASEEERAAARLLLGALEAPFRALVANAGDDAGQALAAVAGADAALAAQAGRYLGYDVLTGRAVDLRAAGIIDSARLVQAVVRAALSGAALALTIDVIVHHKRPALALEPEA
ncbi:MAG: hypothetical protein IT317_03685 [Anaerolineales bacterium]|nr:hypothetical protein [Anaerolineales bacterium]